MNGASSFAVSTRQWRSVSNAAGSPSQNRRRETRTYQLDISSTNSAIALPAVVESKSSSRSRTISVVACRRESEPAVERGLGVRAARRSSGAPSSRVRVEDEERVGVPERQQELADRLADGVGAEAVAGPRLLGGEVVPAEGVGAVGVDDLVRVDEVAEPLAHLPALGVEDQPEADAVQVVGLVEQQHRLGELRVEPAARLVDPLADEVGREAPLELLLVLERVVELRERHRAAVVPGVDHLGDAPHLAAARLAGQDDVVDVGTVEVDLARPRSAAARRRAR